MNTECPHCGETLEQDADGDSYTYGEEGLCGDCYHEEYEFTCCACEEYGHVNDQHEFCVVFEEGEAGVAPGLYRVIKTPYFWSDMLGGGLFPHALELLSTLPLRWPTPQKYYYTGKTVYQELTQKNPLGYPVGHLCGDCQKDILKQLNRGN